MLDFGLHSQLFLELGRLLFLGIVALNQSPHGIRKFTQESPCVRRWLFWLLRLALNDLSYTLLGLLLGVILCVFKHVKSLLLSLFEVFLMVLIDLGLPFLLLF